MDNLRQNIMALKAMILEGVSGREEREIIAEIAILEKDLLFHTIQCIK